MNAEPKNLNVTPETEPSSTFAAVPMWLIVGTLVMFFLGAWFFDTRGGWFEAKVYEPQVSIPDLERFQPPPAEGPDLRLGRVKFELICAQCHNTDGSGKPNQAPPLVGSEWVLGNPNRVIRIPQLGLNGPIQVSGQQWNLSMAAMGAPFNDDELAAVLSYIRTSWGNKASLITAEQVKKVRDELKGRSTATTVDELNKVQ
jgi:mono/diheme cytochrome c family protein